MRCCSARYPHPDFLFFGLSRAIIFSQRIVFIPLTERTMFPMNEQISTATRANLETQLSILAALSATAFESFERVVDLNLNAARTSLEDSSATARQMLTARDMQEFLSLTAAQAQPAAAKALAYSRHLANIAANAQNEFNKAAEQQIAEAGRKMSALVDDVSRNAPAGSENMIAIVKSAIGNANRGYEQFSKTTKQAVEAVEANMNSAIGHLSQATEQGSAKSTASRARR